MDDMRVGTLARAVRHRIGWTQTDVAATAGVSQKLVSLFECGRLELLTVRSARQIARTLEIHLPFAPRWRGGDGVRLLDGDHAALMNHVVRVLMASGWDVVVEYTFNHYGERGSVDVIGWHAATSSLLIVEVKSRLLDTQDAIATLGRKRRIVPELLLRERGWSPRDVGVVLVLEELTSNRSAAGRIRSTLDAAFPARTRAVRRWLRAPDGAMTGLVFGAQQWRYW